MEQIDRVLEYISKLQYSTKIAHFVILKLHCFKFIKLIFAKDEINRSLCIYRPRQPSMNTMPVPLFKLNIKCQN